MNHLTLKNCLKNFKLYLLSSLKLLFFCLFLEISMLDLIQLNNREYF